MIEHDQIVLDVAREQLRGGTQKLRIGLRVRNRRTIVNLLRKEFPGRDISIGGNVDILTD